MTADNELLTRYAKLRDEATFTELVRRHLDHVYSTALRLVSGDAHLAEDVCQLVFANLARKAGSLGNCQALSGWLHTSARFAAANLVRTEQRRRQREQATLTMPSTTPNAEPDWDQVRPILDETIAELSDADRDALLLRYFEKKPFTEVGSALGLSENAARMRVDRAVDKLRGRLALRGITSTVAALGTALAQQVVGTAPASLGAQVVGQALAGAGAAGVGAAGFSLAAKLSLAALAVGVLVTAFILVQPKKPVETREAAISAAGGGENATPARGATNQTPGAQQGASGKIVKHSGLELYFVDGKTGLAIADQTISLKGWAAGSNLLAEKKVEVQAGRCTSPFDQNHGPGYWVLTHVEGYADVRLRWEKQQGEVIPDSYTVRLVPPVLIHGWVVDPSGKPVADAEVGFGGGLDENGNGPENHGIDALRTTTDAHGHWELNRIAEDLLPKISGFASHPKYSQARPSLADALQQLRDGTFVFKLGVAGGLSGRVVNTNGEPINHALVRVGILDETDGRTGYSDAKGMFDLAGCKPGVALVTAEMEGYAPAVASVNIGSNSVPIVLTLGEGKTLRLRILDGKGKPIKGAMVWYDCFSQNHQETPLPQVTFHPGSDAEGRVVWEHAPDLTLELRFSAIGFLEHWEENFQPDDQEHVMTLSKALFISGTVRDFDSGELLPKFRLSIGTLRQAGAGAAKPWWSSIDRFNPTFSGGQFRKTLEELMGGRTTNQGYIFRFSAEGYKPEVTRLYQSDEGAEDLNITLHKSKGVLVTVYRPDGSIEAGAQVALMAPGMELNVGPSALNSPYGVPDPAWMLKTDSNGQFLLPDDESVEEVVIAHPDGFVELAIGVVRETGEVHIEPWARVEGVVMRDGLPLAKEPLNLWNNYTIYKPVKLGGHGFATETDSDGKFVFAKVPPGAFQILRPLPVRPSDNGMDYHRQLPIAAFELKSGETKELSLDADTPAQRRQANR